MKKRRTPKSRRRIGIARRRSNREPKFLEKLLRMAYAKSARQNHLIDALHETGIVDSQTDRILHLVTELSMGKGTMGKRLESYLKKARRYRR